MQGLPSVSPVLGLPIKVSSYLRSQFISDLADLVIRVGSEDREAWYVLSSNEVPFWKGCSRDEIRWRKVSRIPLYQDGICSTERIRFVDRLQIHVDLSLPRDRQIKIFSKSGRDSTETRHLLHPSVKLPIASCCSRLTRSAVQHHSSFSRSRHRRSFRISPALTPRNSTPLSPSNVIFVSLSSDKARPRRRDGSIQRRHASDRRVLEASLREDRSRIWTNGIDEEEER